MSGSTLRLRPEREDAGVDTADGEAGAGDGAEADMDASILTGAGTTSRADCFSAMGIGSETGSGLTGAVNWRHMG